MFYNGQKTIIDGELTKSYFQTFEEFNTYMNELNDDECLDVKNLKYSDNKLAEIIMNVYELQNLPELSIDKKMQIIKEIYHKENTSFRQLSRIFGVSKFIVENSTKTDK
ncbi:hypothetical protein SDC9_208570 [bioreactor metagenome]|uniref:Uncharacterized protein n=1 Tax=bioreactor metagenome TaxID=1076179 RepID=A0A645JB05_9ZZZZ